MQRRMYASGTSNHEIHNENDDYWEILLKDIKSNNSWKNKKALDFACGKGRNVSNLLTINKWKRVDGVDISTGNIKYCKDNYKGQNSEWYVNNGIGLEDLSTNEYHFVLSTIALQHIPVYEIRTNLLKEILRVMAPGGILAFKWDMVLHQRKDRILHTIMIMHMMLQRQIQSGMLELITNKLS